MAKKELNVPDGSEKTMCELTCCPCRLDLKKLKPLVKDPKFICKVCGRVANEKKYLCEPTALG